MHSGHQGTSAIGKRIRDAFFKQIEANSSVWQCKCGCKRKDSGRGYSNFVTHVQSEHPDDLQVLLPENSTVSKLSTSPAKSLFYRCKTVHLHRWLDYVINSLQCFYAVENAVYQRMAKYDPIAYKTLMKFKEKLTEIVEGKITSLLLDKFGLVFDGCCCADTHYVGVYTTYLSEDEIGYSKCLLAFSLFEEEDRQDAENHQEFVKFVLSVYNKSLENSVVLIGDNCSTNRRLANDVGISFIGCASHKFNLAVEIILNE